MEPWLFLIAIGVSVAALCQSLSGMGFSLIASPILIMSLGHSQGLPTLVTIALALTATLTVQHRHAIDWKALGWILVPATVTAPGWAWIVGLNDPQLVGRVAGGLAVVAVTLVALPFRPRALTGRSGGVLAGGTSSGMLAAGGIAGPPLAVYTAVNEWNLATVRGTLNAYFTALGMVMFLVVGPPPVAAPTAAAGVAVVLGFLSSPVLNRRVSALWALRLTLLLAGVSGFVLLVVGPQA